MQLQVAGAGDRVRSQIFARARRLGLLRKKLPIGSPVFNQGEVVQAGIIIYRRSGTSLVGKWTHENVAGIFQKEIVRDVAPGTWEGH